VTDGTAGNGNSDPMIPDTTRTQIPLMLAAIATKHDTGNALDTDGRNSGYWLNMAFERTQTIAEDENKT